MDLTYLSKKDILKIIENNSNACIPKDIKQELTDGKISRRDLEDVGIPPEIIQHIFSYSEPDLESQQRTNPDKIKEQGILEVYFWGLRSSGKTCALSGILNTIQNNGHFQSATNCYNEEYLQSLKDKIIRSNNIAYLPNSTPPEMIRYMNFNLIQEYSTTTKTIFGKEKTKQGVTSRKIAFIDLAGELITTIVGNKETKSGSKNNEQITVLKTLLNNASNRKIHFFFIDYDNKNKGLNQVSKLEQLISIFKNEKYFDKTDFIYIVITKSDTFRDKSSSPIHKNKRREFAKDFFNEKCKTLRTNILEICNSGKGINYNRQGKVVLDDFILDFSMGNVYFERLCKFDATSACEIESILFSKVNSTDEVYG